MSAPSNLRDSASNHFSWARSPMSCTPFGFCHDRASVEQQQRLKATIWNMRRLLREAMGDAVPEELAAALAFVAGHGNEFERSFVAWIDLIDVLVQYEEERYGAAPGKGGLKAAELKEVVRQLLRAERLQIPGLPEVLEPIFIDVVVDWTVDVTVLIFNRYGLWKEAEPPPTTLGTYFNTTWRWLARLLKPLLDPLFRLIAYLLEALQKRTQLTPEIQAALDRVEREGLPHRTADLLKSVTDALTWIGAHRKEIVAAFELVFAVVQEAENYLKLSGPEKKAYAIDLLFAVLDELGFVERTGFVFAVLSSLASSSVEAAVFLFNKHDVFSHRSVMEGTSPS
jgi:hypothetical protein